MDEREGEMRELLGSLAARGSSLFEFYLEDLVELYTAIPSLWEDHRPRLAHMVMWRETDRNLLREVCTVLFWRLK